MNVIHKRSSFVSHNNNAFTILKFYTGIGGRWTQFIERTLKSEIKRVNTLFHFILFNWLPSLNVYQLVFVSAAKNNLRSNNNFFQLNRANVRIHQFLISSNINNERLFNKCQWVKEMFKQLSKKCVIRFVLLLSRSHHSNQCTFNPFVFFFSISVILYLIPSSFHISEIYIVCYA